MADEWIKIRASLITSPKVCAMAGYLMQQEDFNRWAVPGNPNCNLSVAAVQSIVLRALVSAWASARAFGKRQKNDDCLLPNLGIDALDMMAAVPKIGCAMELVGWAKDAPGGEGVILPNFFADMNVAKSNSERSKAYRDRKKAAKKPSRSAALTERSPSARERSNDAPEKRESNTSSNEECITLSKEADTSADGPGVATAAGPPLDPEGCRYRLVRAGVDEARNWTNTRVLAEYAKRNNGT